MQWSLLRNMHRRVALATAFSALSFVAAPSVANAVSTARPSPPRSVTASAGNYFATVRWSAPASLGGGSITKYIVFAQPGSRTCVTQASARVCSLWELRNGVRYTFSVTAINKNGSSNHSVPSNAVVPSAKITTKASCNEGVIPPRPPVASAVLSVVTAYYTAKHLGPITTPFHYQTVLNVHEQLVGVHYCRNSGGGLSGYTGVVPANATAAVQVFAKHKPYPVVGATSNFVTLAAIPGVGWKVVGEGTGP